jgi:hypothetical protein
VCDGHIDHLFGHSRGADRNIQYHRGIHSQLARIHQYRYEDCYQARSSHIYAVPHCSICVHTAMRYIRSRRRDPEKNKRQKLCATQPHQIQGPQKTIMGKNHKLKQRYSHVQIFSRLFSFTVFLYSHAAYFRDRTDYCEPKCTSTFSVGVLGYLIMNYSVIAVLLIIGAFVCGCVNTASNPKQEEVK